MRDQARDQESAENYAERSDQELIDLARALNRRLINLTAELADVWWDEADALVRAQAMARELQAIRYELARGRIPNPSGASVSITGSTLAGVNSGDSTNTG
jgi:hypothetical protein